MQMNISKKNKAIDMSKTIFVWGLADRTRAQDIWEFYSRGKVECKTSSYQNERIGTTKGTIL